ncbi:outer membrane beta-barrel protein [Acetobacter estunensis]|uniref:outer membrane beta-barrel protein n=1 Tax=Acetobacter estunensis TaxID=104097 RepID=UPI001C2D5EB8|nr:outer membrane beta-barrel protein [Acetobacter estunensis]MBV1836150.1 porin [Acetobacter estunensis]
MEKVRYLVATGVLAVMATEAATTARAEVSLFEQKTDASEFENWLRGTTLAGHIEGGISANPARPDNGINFGNFIGDHANQPQLNQFSLKLAHPVDTSGGYSFGFTLEASYGSDSRYYHLLGISDRALNSRYQIIPAQAHVDAHLPWFTKLGVEMHAGILQAPMGPEAFDPTARPFYTFSYTGEYSVPFEHVGMMATIHVSPMIDVLTGIDTGNQTTFGRSDNNDEPAGYAGIALNNLADGKLTITELSRFGPENSRRVLGNREANSAMRFWNDIMAVYQVTPTVTLTGEFNYLHDDGLRADAESFVSYLSWKFAPEFTFNYRGEIYRDNTGQLVSNALTDEGYMNGVAGRSTPVESAPPTTYGALTLGVTWRKALTKDLGYFAIRPEVRFDRSLNGTTPFNDGRNSGMFTFGGDMMIGF